MRAFACVFLIACGGSGNSEVEGEPLISSTLQAQFNNKAWTPLYGFGRTDDTSFGIYVGHEKIACADDFERPRNGDYGGAVVPAPLTTGTYTSSAFNLIEVIDGELVGKGATGSVMITNVSDTQVSAVLGFSTTIDNGQYSLTGAVTLLRCP